MFAKKIKGKSKDTEKLNCIWVSERGQSEKAINCLIPVTWHGKAETTAIVKDQCLPGLGGVHRGLLCNYSCMRLPWWVHVTEYTAGRGSQMQTMDFT